MEDEELDNIIVLNDENGNEVKFEFLDLVELDDEEYVVLLHILHRLVLQNLKIQI